MPPGRCIDAVLLLHGIARTSVSMRPLQHALEREGYAVLNLDHRSRHLPLSDLAEAIHLAVSRFAAETPGALHAVGIRWERCCCASISRAAVRCASGAW